MTVKPVTQRSSNRVENYVNYRPGYPTTLLTLLIDKIFLTENTVIADIGCGTGKSSEMFINNKNLVLGVEPNDEMREAAEDLFKYDPNFISIKGTAEETTLAAHSIDMIISGQAFHRFARTKTRAEFARILKPKGWVVLFWNERGNKEPFLQDYESFLLLHSANYKVVDHRLIDDDVLKDFFGNNSLQSAKLSYYQLLDFEGLKGRYLSSSYSLSENDPKFSNAMAYLHYIFDQHQKNGLVKMNYVTKVYFGQLTR